MLDKAKIHAMMAKMRRFRNQHFATEHGRTNWTKISIMSALTIGSLFVFLVLLLITSVAILSIGLPDVRDLDNLSVAQSTTIYDREGNILYVKYGEENREYKKLDQISKNIKDATLAIEDDQFYNHPGFDISGLMRAIINDVTHGTKQGGSTITQQYIKLTFLSSEKSYIRKIKELILAIRLEEAFDKDTILEKYLNKIPYGNSAFGVEKASQIYFNKSAKDLDLAESAILASIPQAPSYYNPYGPNKFSRLSTSVNVDALGRRRIQSESDLRNDEFRRGLIGQSVDVSGATEGNSSQKVYIQGRSDLVLRRMVETGHITEQQKNAALEKIHNIEFIANKQNVKAPHFVLNMVLQQLEDKYGKELVEGGGLKVYTTLDPKMQEIAEQAINSRAEKYQKTYNVKNESLVALNPQNSQILALVGSRDYFSKDFDGQTNIATSYRQFGSSFKPIVYAATFLNRHSPASIIFDAPTPFGSDTPKNFDGKFQGPITMRKALGQSRNIPAVKSYFLGGEQKAIMPLAKSMGIKFLNEEMEYGYPMALGTAETTLLSMTTAYATFANAGVRHDPVSILRVENAQGEILEEWRETPGEQAIDPQIAYLITSILSDHSVNVGPNLNINGQIVAAKTGTSNRKNGSQYLPHDLLTMGHSTQLAVGVWSGNNDDSKDGPLNASADGYNVSAPIFKEFMEKALAGKPSEAFPIPTGIKQETVSKFSGKLVTDLTPIDEQITDFFASFAVPTEVDDSYNGQPDFTAAETLASAPCGNGQQQQRFMAILHDIDPTRTTWEEAAQKWLAENNDILANQTGSVSCVTITEQETPQINIINLIDGQQITDKTFTVQVEPITKDGVTEVLYYLDGNLQYKQDQIPFSGNIRLPKTGKIDHKLTIRIYDRSARIGEKSLTIYSGTPPITTSTTTPAIPATSPTP